MDRGRCLGGIHPDILGHIGTCFTAKAQAAVQKLHTQDATDLSARRRYHYHHYRYAYRPYYYYGSPYYDYAPVPIFPFLPFIGVGWGPYYW